MRKRFAENQDELKHGCKLSTNKKNLRKASHIFSAKPRLQTLETPNNPSYAKHVSLVARGLLGLIEQLSQHFCEAGGQPLPEEKTTQASQKNSHVF